MDIVRKYHELELVKITDEDLKTLQGYGYRGDIYRKRIGRYILYIIDDAGKKRKRSILLLVGLDINSRKDAMYAFETFTETFKAPYKDFTFSKHYYFFYPDKKMLSSVEPLETGKTGYTTTDVKVKPKKPEYYAVIPTSIVITVKVIT